MEFNSGFKGLIYIGVVSMVVWLHMLSSACRCVCLLHCMEPDWRICFVARVVGYVNAISFANGKFNSHFVSKKMKKRTIQSLQEQTKVKLPRSRDMWPTCRPVSCIFLSVPTQVQYKQNITVNIPLSTLYIRVLECRC